MNLQSIEISSSDPISYANFLSSVFDIEVQEADKFFSIDIFSTMIRIDKTANLQPSQLSFQIGLDSKDELQLWHQKIKFLLYRLNTNSNLLEEIIEDRFSLIDFDGRKWQFTFFKQ